MSLRLITAPSTYPVTLAEAKAHLRVDSTDEDTLITAMISAATDVAEQHTGRAIMPQTWELSLDEFQTPIELTRIPAASVTSIQYIDATGAEIAYDVTATGITLDAGDDFGFAYILPAYGTVWPTTREQPNAVKVRYVAGYADAAAVPEAIKSWIKLQVSAMFENREAEAYSARAVSTTVKMSFVDGLLAKYKVYGA
jgi:uncharacterized phiE125 gp8 family phage protein